MYESLKSVIFLDIDGVLNNNKTPNQSPRGFIGVEDQYLHRLSIIVKESKADIVLVSDWKDHWNPDPELCDIDAMYLNRRLKEHGVYIQGKTKDISHGNDWRSGRGSGIKKYLLEYSIEKYIILDDTLFSDYDDTLQEHLIQTKQGLTDQDVEHALKILNISK